MFVTHGMPVSRCENLARKPHRSQLSGDYAVMKEGADDHGVDTVEPLPTMTVGSWEICTQAAMRMSALVCFHRRDIASAMSLTVLW